MSPRLAAPGSTCTSTTATATSPNKRLRAAPRLTAYFVMGRASPSATTTATDTWISTPTTGVTTSRLSTSRLLHNLGAANPGHFEDVTAAAGLDVYRPSHFYDGGTDTNAYRHTSTFTDLDRDGHPDLAIAGDFKTSQLFWNNGDGTFTDGTIGRRRGYRRRRDGNHRRRLRRRRAAGLVHFGPGRCARPD